MVDIHEERERVGPYDYRRDGREVHVRGHPSHHPAGTPLFFVLYREPDVRESGGSRERPRNEHHPWRALRRHFHEERPAEHARRRMEAEGYAAIVEKVGGLTDHVDVHELLRHANERDRELREERRGR